MVSLENVLIYTTPPTITSLGAVCVAWIGNRAGRRNEQKLHSIDRAVNGTEPQKTTLRENVQTLVERTDGTKT